MQRVCIKNEILDEDIDVMFVNSIHMAIWSAILLHIYSNKCNLLQPSNSSLSLSDLYTSEHYDNKNYPFVLYICCVD